MARTYINLPTLFIDFIKPQRMKVDVVASAIDGGRNMLGQTISVGASGGGYVTAAYESCWVHEREEHEYANWLGAYLNGSTRFINVPLKTDWMGPFPVLDRWPAPLVTGIPHSDGATFSDGAGYSQPTVWGRVLENAGVGAGQIKIRVFGAARPIRWSDWFSLSHPTKGNRAYRSWQQTEIGSGSEAEPGSGVSTAYRDYLLGIGPALREAATAGMRVEFARPMFAAKLPPGVTVPWEVESFWVSRPTLQFTEAF